MDQSISVTTLFVDIGGVLLTNGWSHVFRKLAAQKFHLDLKELEDRHNKVFETFELDRLTMKEYLHLVVFYEQRDFTAAQFQKFMFERSEPFPEMIGLIRQLRVKYGLKVVVVSNEARLLNAYRIQKFGLDEFVDAFISSCYVGLRKPDAAIFRLARDIVQVPTEQIVYIDNTLLFVQIAEGMGIHSLWHTDYKSTCEKLAAFGLEIAI